MSRSPMVMAKQAPAVDTRSVDVTALMIICGAALVLGVAAGIVWSARSFEAPDASAELTALEVARRFVWYVSIAFTAGVLAGISVIGAGGRLAMRLLAVTAGDQAQGRLTEAGEIVGEISVDGTIAFVLFNGIIGGVIAGGLFILVRRFLPEGRMGGVTYGLGLLLVFGAIVDPIRADNPDFDIVGPSWVAVLVFTLMAIALGLAVQGIAARMSTWLPLFAIERSTLLRYLLPAAIAVLAFSMTAFMALIGLVAMLVTRWHVVVDVVRSQRWVAAGRALLVVIVLVSLPNTLSNAIDILGR